MTSENNSLTYLPPEVIIVHLRIFRDVLVGSYNVETEDLVEVEW